MKPLFKDFTKYQFILPVGLALGGLWVCSLYNYLLFHTLVEFFSVAVALALFFIVWNTRDFMEADYLLFLGIASFFVAGIDLFHAMAYKGMGIFPTDDPNLSTQLWVAGRYLQSISWLVMPVMIGRKVSARSIAVIYSGITVLLLTAIFIGWFPDCYLEGSGLTPFKKVSEYVVSAMYLASGFLLWRKRQAFDAGVANLLMLSLIFNIFAELAFTSYVSVYGEANLVGHFFRLFAFYLIYRAVIQTGLVQPYKLLFKQTAESQEKLRESEARFEQMADNIGEVFWMFDNREQKPIYMNAAYENIYGRSLEETYKNPQQYIDAIHPEDRDTMFAALEKQARGERTEMQYRIVHADGSFRWIHDRSFPIFAQDGTLMRTTGIATDITARKQMEAELRESEELFRAFFENATEAILITKPDGSILKANPAACRMFKRTEQEFIEGRREAVVDLTDPRLAALLETRRQTGKMFGEVTLVRSDGAKFEGEVTSAIYLDKNGAEKTSMIVRDVTERKLAQQALQKSQALLLEAQRIGRMGYIEWNGQGIDLVCSDEIYAIFDLPREQPITQQVLAAKMLPEERQQLTQLDLEAFARRSNVEYEYRIRLADGRMRWLHQYGDVGYDEQGKPIHMLAVCQDITARKEAEEKLRESEERLELVMAGSQLGYWDWNIETGEVHRNVRWAEMLGYTLEEVNSTVKQWTDLHHPDDREAAWASIQDHLEGKTSAHRIEYRMRAKDGQYKWILDQARVVKRDAQGKPLRMSGTHTDITERKQAEEQLRASEAKFKAVFDNAPVGISLIDAGRNLLESNDMLAQVVHMEKTRLAAGGYRKRRYIREDGSEILTSELASTRAIVERRAIRDVVNGIVLEDGEVIWTQVSAAPLGLDDPRFVVITQDITARKRAVDDLRRSNAELEQFAYVASHDLQEPLRTVSGMMQLLQQRYQSQLDEHANEYIHYAVDASERMQQLIKDLLEFSRVERQGRPFTATKMEAVLQMALANLQTAIAESGAQITFDPLPTVQADAGQLTQVLQNLLSNAIKYRSEQPPEIHISVEKFEHGWQFAVRDNGIGIDPQYFERVFLLFQRLHTRRKYPGTGIGLALCKKIVERHGGQLWIQSAVDQGATFYFTIPERS